MSLQGSSRTCANKHTAAQQQACLQKQAYLGSQLLHFSLVCVIRSLSRCRSRGSLQSEQTDSFRSFQQRKNQQDPGGCSTAHRNPHGHRSMPALPSQGRHGRSLRVHQRKIPEEGGRFPRLRKLILDFHVTRLALKGLKSNPGAK